MGLPLRSSRAPAARSGAVERETDGHDGTRQPSAMSSGSSSSRAHVPADDVQSEPFFFLPRGRGRRKKAKPPVIIGRNGISVGSWVWFVLLQGERRRGPRARAGGTESGAQRKSWAELSRVWIDLAWALGPVVSPSTCSVAVLQSIMVSHLFFLRTKVNSPSVVPYCAVESSDGRFSLAACCHFLAWRAASAGKRTVRKWVIKGNWWWWWWWSRKAAAFVCSPSV